MVSPGKEMPFLGGLCFQLNIYILTAGCFSVFPFILKESNLYGNYPILAKQTFETTA